MLTHRQDERILQTAVAVVLVALAFLLVWIVANQMSQVPIAQTTVQIEPVLALPRAGMEFAMETPLVAYTSDVEYKLPLAYREFVMEVPLVAYTSSVEYKLPVAQRELVMEVPLVAYTSSVEYKLPAATTFEMDVPLVALTAGIESQLPAQADRTFIRTH